MYDIFLIHGLDRVEDGDDGTVMDAETDDLPMTTRRGRAAGIDSLTNAERRRWRRLAVAFERLTVLCDDVELELGATSVTIRLRGGEPGRELLARAAVLAESVPDTVIDRSDTMVRASVRHLPR